MDPADLQPLLDQLGDDVDDLEEVLQPILASGLLKSSSKLPVMDKAKLYVKITYALESLIFSYLRLHRTNAQQHPAFTELVRLKQYFVKIKGLETEPEERQMTLDKEAASRFIKHGLAGNDKYDLERAEKQAKERARAQLKAEMLARKSQETSASGATSEAQTNDDSDNDDSDGGVKVTDNMKPPATEKKEKKHKSKGEHKSKDKKERKHGNKAALREEKKQRRLKKQEKRNARNAQ
ncbi:unnamed protein product [Penicillium olsonii]|nr:unnamed protein product [Penicillium olsonii]